MPVECPRLDTLDEAVILHVILTVVDPPIRKQYYCYGCEVYWKKWEKI